MELNLLYYSRNLIKSEILYPPLELWHECVSACVIFHSSMQPICPVLTKQAMNFCAKFWIYPHILRTKYLYIMYPLNASNQNQNDMQKEADECCSTKQACPLTDLLLALQNIQTCQVRSIIPYGTLFKSVDHVYQTQH